MKRKQNILSVIPAVWVSVFDIIITTIYQPTEYWQGNLSLANEGNPIGNFAMKYHASGLFIISILWIAIITLLGIYLPKKIAQVFLLFAIIAHSWGAASWIHMNHHFIFVMLFFLFNAALFYYIDGKVKAKVDI